MEPRLSLITLGVENLEAATRFYEALGFPRKGKLFEGVAFFDLNGLAFSLYPRKDFLQDAHLTDNQPAGVGMTLAHNVREKSQVAAILSHAELLGANILRSPHETPWGGYVGYFQDLDGHVWEIARNPGFVIQSDGSLVLPD